MPDWYREQVNHAIGFAGRASSSTHGGRPRFSVRWHANTSDLQRSLPFWTSVVPGIGLVDPYLTETFAEVAGVDVSEDEVARARKSIPEFRTRCQIQLASPTKTVASTSFRGCRLTMHRKKSSCV